MEKISRIIPPSTRQVWVSGEPEKPKRAAVARSGEFEPQQPSAVAALEKMGRHFETAEMMPHESEMPVGTKLNVRA